MTTGRRQRSYVDDPRVRILVTVLVVGLLLFNPVWTTIRFSGLFGRLLSMQLAYDEPYYFWQIVKQVQDGALDINYRLLSKLPAAALLWAGVSLDAVMTVYGMVLPLVALAGAVWLASTWERRSVGRLIWAVALLFSFDFLSGGSRVIDYEPPANWLSRLVGDPALLRPDVMSFFLIHRRPEPQASWCAIFPYFALLIDSFVHGRRDRYLLVCALTPLLAIIYINIAIVALMVFGMLSLLSLTVYRRPVVVPFVLSILVTLAAFVLIFRAGTTSSSVALTVFQTHLPMLRPSIGFALAGLAWAGLAFRRHGASPQRWAAMVFFIAPIVALNQQIVTGIAVTPQNWDIYINYVCIMIGAGLLSGQYLSTLERRTDWRQFLPIGLLTFIGFVVVQGALRNEVYWSLDNVRSVLFGEVLSQAKSKAGQVDAVILPHLFDESLFLTRVPRGTTVLGGYNAMIEKPVPMWPDDESFAEHAKAASASFAEGFETLFRSGVSVSKLQSNMLAELKTGDCWLGLSYFFSLGDCWPAFLNFTSSGTKRLPSAVPQILALYSEYLEHDAARDLAKRQVLLIRNQPLPADDSGLIDNQLVGTAEVDMRGTPVRAYGYIQRQRGP